MTRRARVDAELVRRGLARSRQQAAELIGAGRVTIDGMPAAKPATAVAVSAALTVEGDDERTWVSRGAHKLIGALDAFGLSVDNRRCLDAGASTGGFTEVLLDRGAREVVAVDVGYGQLAWSLRNDPRVIVLERTNVRELTADAIGGPVDLVVADLSFISLATVLPALTSCASDDADIVPMVKPQFEVGKDRVGAGGVVSDPQLRADAVLAVARRAAELQWQSVGVAASPLPGPSGNVEYFLHLRARAESPLQGDRLEQAVHQAVCGGSAMTCERTILLVVHTGRDEATEVARRVEKVLGDNDIGLRVLSAEAVDRGPVHLAPDDMRSLGVEIEVVDADERAAEGCELVLVLGGDGTFLRAAELARNVEIPVLGVNLGRIGFLAEAEADHIDSVLDHVVNRDYRVEERMTLDVVVRAGGDVVDRGWALNEASLEKGPRLGVLGAVVEVDGRPVSAFGCDGVLVATPTGSTAWAFSAGGPIVWPDLDAILVVPNNAHALFARPMVTSPNATIAIEIEADGHDALVFCDGRREMVVPAGGRLEVTRCGTPLKWVRLDSAPFTDRLVRKFRLPVTGWRGQ